MEKVYCECEGFEPFCEYCHGNGYYYKKKVKTKHEERAENFGCFFLLLGMGLISLGILHFVFSLFGGLDFHIGMDLIIIVIGIILYKIYLKF